MVTATLKKNPGPSLLKHNGDYSCFQENCEATFFSN